MKLQIKNALWVVLTSVTVLMTWPGLAPAEQTNERPDIGILRISILNLTVHGKQEVSVVREAMTVLLPQLADCIQAEYQRVNKVPTRIVLRLNVAGCGKIVWCKIVDPVLKTLDNCVCKILQQMQLPAGGEEISRVTVLLGVKIDHLLTP